MKKQLVLCCVAAMFTILLNSCSNNAPSVQQVEQQAKPGNPASNFGPTSTGGLETEIYKRLTNVASVTLHGEMIKLTDNCHLIPVMVYGIEEQIQADMLDNEVLYNNFQTALTRLAHGQRVFVKLVIEENVFKKDRFIVTEFIFPVDQMEVNPQPIVPMPNPVHVPNRPKKVTETKKDCGCCGNSVVVNAGSANVTVNNGSVSVKADSLTAKKSVEKVVIKDSQENNTTIADSVVVKKSNKFLDFFKKKPKA